MKGPWDNDPEASPSSKAAPWEKDAEVATQPIEGGWAPRVAREGMPVNRKEAMKEQIRAERANGSNPIVNTLNTASNRLGTGWRSAVGSIPFGDDMVAGLATVAPSDFDYSLPAAERFARNRDYVEAQHAVDWEKEPVSTAVGTVGGLLAGPGAKYIAEAPGVASTAWRSGLVGAGYGAADGLGSNGTAEQRAERGVRGAAMGAGFGAGAPLVARGAGALGAEMLEPIVGRYQQWRNPQGYVDRLTASALNADERAGRVISDADLAAARRASSPLVLGDMGGDATQALARTAANANPAARGIMENVVDPRYEGQSGRLSQMIGNLFDIPSPAALRARIDEAERLVNRRAYKELYGNYRILYNENLMNLLDVPEVARAAETVLGRNPGMRAAGMSSGPMSRDIPNIEFWDRIQRELRDRARGASGERAQEAAALYNGLRQQIVGEVDRLTGGRYSDVRHGAAQFFGAENALEAGQNFFRQNNLNQLEAARDAISRFSEAERRLFAQGFAAEMAHASGNTAASRNIPIQSWLSAPNAQEKMRLALGEGRANDILSVTNVESGMNRLRTAIKGNSTTLRQMLESGLFGGGIGVILEQSMDPYQAFTNPAGLVFGAARALASRHKGMSPAIAERLARQLMSNDPAVLDRMMRQAARDGGRRSFLRELESVITRGGSQELSEKVQGYADGGPVEADRQAQIDALPEIDPLGPEKALGRGIVEGAQTAGRYLRDTPIRQMPKDVGKVAGAMWEGAKEDPVGFALDMTPVVGEARSFHEGDKLLVAAMEAEKAGDPDTAAKLRQLAALSMAGAVPLAGMGARAAKRAGKAAEEATLSSIIKRGVPIEPRTPRPDEAVRQAALADTRVGGDIVGQRINTLIPEQDRVVGGTYTPGAPGGGRWADMPEDVLGRPGAGFKVTDDELRQLWEQAVEGSSAAAKKAVADHGVVPQFLSKDWDAAMRTPLRDHLWYELSGERLAENMPDLKPDEFMQLMDLIGATSARAVPGENLERALGVLSQKLRGRPVDVDLTIPSTVQQALGRSHEGGSSALPGNKTGYFSDTLALTGGVPTRFPISVNDVWVGKMFGVPDEVMSSNQALHEPMALYFNKIRDLYNQRHGGEVPFPYQSWNFQAPAWVHLRNQEAGATSGDAYHQVWGGILDKLRAAGVKGINGDVITREALMDPKFADAVRRTTPGWRDAPKATVEFGTTQTNVGRTAYDLYKQAIEAGDELSQQDYLKGLTTAMYQSARGKHPWDSLKKAITGDLGQGSDITRIAHPNTDAPLDIGGTFEGMVSPNIRVPLKDMSDAQIRYFNAIAGNPLRQDAMAASQFLPVEAGAAPREGYTRTMSAFVPTTEKMTPAEIRSFSKAMSEAGHDLSYVRYPNGYKFDILPNFSGDAPVGVSREALEGAYDATLARRFGAPSLMEHDFKSVYTPGEDYAAARKELLEEMKNGFLENARAAGISPRDAQRYARAAEQGKVPDTLTGRGRKAWDSYRARLGHLADAEQGFQALAERVASSHATFAEKATARMERARKKAQKGMARGGPVRRPVHDLDSFIQATASLEPQGRRFAMGGPVFPAAVEPRQTALTRRGALSMIHGRQH